MTFSITGEVGDTVREMNGYKQLHEICKAADAKLHFTIAAGPSDSSWYGFVVSVDTGRPYSESGDSALMLRKSSEDMRRRTEEFIAGKQKNPSGAGRVPSPPAP